MLSSLLIPFIKIAAGFGLLIWGADRFVTGAAACAKHLNISPLIIGLLVIGFATSAPEMFVSAISSFQGSTGIAIGNAIGSNITNIALVLGLTALALPISITSQIIKQELPLLLLISIIIWILLRDNELSRLDGIIFVAGMIMVLSWTIRSGLKQRQNGPDVPYLAEALAVKEIPLMAACVWLVLGLIILLFASNILVQGAVDVAEYFNVSELVIGLTIVAIGTSLPELAASIAAALKRQHDMVIGNVIGSNIFNLLVVLALPGLIEPGKLPDGVLNRDIPVMLFLTLLLLFMAYSFTKRNNRINRIEGACLLLCFAAYQISIFFSAHGN